MYGERRVVGELESAFEHARGGDVDAWESVYLLCRPTLFSLLGCVSPPTSKLRTL